MKKLSLSSLWLLVVFTVCTALFQHVSQVVCVAAGRLASYKQRLRESANVQNDQQHHSTPGSFAFILLLLSVSVFIEL